MNNEPTERASERAHDPTSSGENALLRHGGVEGQVVRFRLFHMLIRAKLVAEVLRSVQFLER